MDIDDEDDTSSEATEIGSDELLSDENLHLPESANILVRLHAVRVWLARRHDEAAIEVGEAALALQEIMQEEPHDTRIHRREQQLQRERLQQAQKSLNEAQQRLSAYEEAQSLLEECIAHTTSSERVLVEYYLTLEDLVQAAQTSQPESSPWLSALADVQHRIEQVGAPNEE
jgi:hypothetical protein